MKTALLTLVLVALTAVWVAQRFSAAELEAQIAGRHGGEELSVLQRERERLRGRQPTPRELQELREAVAGRVRHEAAVAAEAATPVPALPLGAWSRASNWRNRGQATAQAAIESTLWAAAGGDVGALKQLFLLPAATREKAGALLAQLPPAARAGCATAEDLIAAFTIKSIPIGEAQLVWFNQSGADEATACVFLQLPPEEGASLPEPPAPPPVVTPRETELQAALKNAATREDAVRLAEQLRAERARRVEREPPRAPDTPRSSEAYLSLQRTGDGWRLVVPPSAVDGIARELRAPRS